ncbi:type I secretion system protein LssZ [Legionella geestiana]|uniref:type I secretion system protein LssZ n=1 Tax=Legionella geestiana TaxID=45065 RepID=UPI0010932859|nr:type I secretion system protein LssZ [Legionella geestiana]QDQ39023.1 type I secretion system protein LssZ [Legionella geestiana]
MMQTFTAIQYLAPVLSALLLFMGFRKRRVNLVLAALWISLLALMLQYKLMGRAILGAHFDYANAVPYSLNLIIVVAAIVYLLFSSPRFHAYKLVRIVSILFALLLFSASTILLINLWVNARFMESRLDGTPVVQVGTFNKPDWCAYDYVFYIVDTKGRIRYLCPNHYGLLPSTGILEAAPDFLVGQLTTPPKAKIPMEASDSVN